MKIVIFDTAFGSGNLGDQIIMEAVNSEIESLFPEAFLFRVPTHAAIGRYGRRLIREADLIFAGGTNLLFSYWKHHRQWALEFSDLKAISQKLVLMGTGWTDYQSPPDWRARYAYKKMLSPSALHSLRDSYSEKHLNGCGFNQVVNTGCPTLWNLPDINIEGSCSQTVITTLTDYRPSPEHDKAMLTLLKSHYGKVLLWVQGSGDLDYARSLDIEGWEPIRPSLQAFDTTLTQNRSIDYVGTRLHAGIRALQKGRRALILSVDNRAKEMGQDFLLPVVERGKLGEVEKYIEIWPQAKLRLPQQAIAAWRNQFQR